MHDLAIIASVMTFLGSPSMVVQRLGGCMAGTPIITKFIADGNCRPQRLPSSSAIISNSLEISTVRMIEIS